jgi:hypothetical protein
MSKNKNPMNFELEDIHYITLGVIRNLEAKNEFDLKKSVETDIRAGANKVLSGLFKSSANKIIEQLMHVGLVGTDNDYLNKSAKYYLTVEGEKVLLEQPEYVPLPTRSQKGIDIVKGWDLG